MMADIKEVHELNPIVDDPRFEGFALAIAPSVLGRDSLDDDLTPGFSDAEENPNWQQPSLLSHWIPPKANGRVSEFNDYPCVDMVLPAFSERAVNRLRQLLVPNGELLLLDSETKTQFFLFNVLTISDALDRSRSKCEFWSDPPTTATNIEHFEFQPHKLTGHSIFRIRELPSSVFVTDHFMDRVDFFGLQGFSFTKVWPLPKDVNWRLQEPLDARKDRNRRKQETLVLALPFKGSLEQSRALSAFEDLADQRLKVADLQHPYLGSYEGHDQNEYEYRMFFSTPNADKLYEHLQGDIRSLKWFQPIKVYLRHGHIYDESATEIMKEI